MATVKFETAIKQLEDIVKNLEQGTVSIEEALKLFEEGIKLTNACTKILDDTEAKVSILLKNKDGELTKEKFADLEGES